MNITRNVILDFLPLYVADEVSDDTRALVEQYLKTDQELAQVASDMKNQLGRGDIPVALDREDTLKAYLEAKRILLKRTIIWAAVAAFAITGLVTLAALAFFRLSSFGP